MTSNIIHIKWATAHHLIITQDHHYHNSFFPNRGQPPAEAPTRIRPRSKEKRTPASNQMRSIMEFLKREDVVRDHSGHAGLLPSVYTGDTHLCTYPHYPYVSLSANCCMPHLHSISVQSTLLLDVCIVPMFLNSHGIVSLTMQPQIA